MLVGSSTLLCAMFDLKHYLPLQVLNLQDTTVFISNLNVSASTTHLSGSSGMLRLSLPPRTLSDVVTFGLVLEVDGPPICLRQQQRSIANRDPTFRSLRYPRKEIWESKVCC
jgi:hypothetical protein